MTLIVIGRLVASLVAAPLLYGMLCLPLGGWLMSSFPEHLNEWGGTHFWPLVGAFEVLQALVLLVCGAVVGWIGGSGRWRNICLTGATVDMLVIAIGVQQQFWEAMPVWHHWVFFLMIVVLIPLGAHLQSRISARAA